MTRSPRVEGGLEGRSLLAAHAARPLDFLARHGGEELGEPLGERRATPLEELGRPARVRRHVEHHAERVREEHQDRQSVVGREALGVTDGECLDDAQPHAAAL
eukprot:2023952-Prymnesium_polylepis.1